MALYALGRLTPTIHPTAFVHPDAVIIGDVLVGAEASVWPTTVLRGDTGRVVVGDQTSVQDGTVVHCTEEFDTVIGARCVIGHRAHLEGCTVEDESLVGSGSVVLHRVLVRSGALIAAQALVSPGTEVPSYAVAMGVPARIKPDAVPDGLIAKTVTTYVGHARRYNAELRRLT